MSSKHIFELVSENPAFQTVDAGWAVFKIKIVSSLKSGAANCWGTCDFDTYEIQLEKKMADAPARETLLHEICHILLEFCGLGESDEESSDYMNLSNEKLTITMSRAIIMFVRLNPELSKELLNLK